ncbi:MAG: metal-dependent hydrolase [Rhodothermales bacterium]
MDSLTQATLGAAVGEAVLGRKVGGKAALWGAALGTLPDLDVLANPFVSEMEALAIHRGITHSIVFAVVLAPVVGLLASRLHRKPATEGLLGYRFKRTSEASWGAWTLLAFLALITHPLLDCFTVYGTQVFQPFSNYPVAFSSIFIIDPLYTVPLFAGVVAALFMSRTPHQVRGRLSGRRRWANGLGLGLSTAYLLATLGIKAQVHSTFEASLAAQDVRYEELLTAPMPLNSLLWMGLAHSGDTVRVGLYSVLDDDNRIAFEPIATRRDLLEPYENQTPVERLLWFSRGYYQAEARGDTLLFHDLRFGRTDAWLTDSGDYLFTFRLRRSPSDSTRLTGFEQQGPSLDLGDGFLERYTARVMGSVSP